MIIKELFAKLGLDIDKGGFTTADVLLAGVKTGLVALGGVAIAAAAGLGVLIHDLVETTGELNDTSQAIGVDVEALQELGFAAKLAGGSIDSLRTGISILSKHIVAASEGNDEAQKTFSKFGLKIRDASGHLKTADVIIGEVAGKFEKMPDGPKKTAAAMELFGKSGAGLIPMLNEGQAGLAKLRAEARELGAVIDRETIKAGDDLGDNLDRLKVASRGLGYAIAGPLLGPVNELVTTLLEWVKANRAIIATRIERVARVMISALKTLGQVLAVMWKVLNAVIENWRLFAVILGSVALAAVLLNITAIATLIAGYVRAGIAAVAAGLRAAAAWAVSAAPLVLIAALIAIVILLIDEWITHMQGGDTILGKLWPKWKAFLDDFANGGNDKEPIWLQFLRFGAALLADFDKTWHEIVEGWKLLITDLADWIVAQFDRALNFVGDKMKGSIDKIKSLLHIGEPGNGGIFGGGSSPSASVQNTTGGRSANTTTRNEITIHQRPGQSSADLADELQSRLDEHHQARVEETFAALNL